MTNAASPSPTAANSASATAARHRPSQTLAAGIARANLIAAALPALLTGIAKANAEADSVPIDAPWVARLTSAIAAAEQAQGERAAAKVGQEAATASEHAAAVELVGLLVKVRALVEIHNPQNVAAQHAYGRGGKFSAHDLRGTLAVAQGYIASWNGQWKQPAASAGVTQPTINQIASLAATLSQVVVKEQAAKTTGAQGTLSRDAALAALSSMCAFAVRVVTAVYGKGSPQLASLANSLPRQARGAARKATTKAKAKASTARVAAKKAVSRAKPGARGAARVRKEKRVAIAARTAALLAAPKKAPKSKGAKKKAQRSQKAKKR